MIAAVALAALVSADAVGPPYALLPGSLPPLRETSALPGWADYAGSTGWSMTDSVSLFGSIAWAGGTLALHLESPASPRGTLVLVHGYMDHSGLMSGPARHFLSNGWIVAAPDLPGHGLSDGARGDIESFERYGQALRAVLDTLEARKSPRPWVAVGHSTGGAALLELVRSGEARLDRVALVAPLVRMNSASWVRAGLPVARLWTEGVKRVTKRRATHDSAWHERMAADPLELRLVPLTWVRVALDWETTVARSEFPGPRWLFVQGDQDATVDGRAGERILEGRIPGLVVVRVPGGWHHLLNEAPPWRDVAHDAIDHFLQDGESPFPSEPGKGTLNPS